MKELTLHNFHVKDIQFADKSSYKDGVLYIDKKELAEYLMEDSRISSVDFDIARPGESTRIIERAGADIPGLRWRCRNGWQR